jgi:hypothetical protein
MHGASRRAKQVLARRIGTFLRQYGRKAQRGCEPNDHGYDVRIERFIRRLKPEDLDFLLNGDGDEQPNVSMTRSNRLTNMESPRAV